MEAPTPKRVWYPKAAPARNAARAAAAEAPGAGSSAAAPADAVAAAAEAAEPRGEEASQEELRGQLPAPADRRTARGRSGERRGAHLFQDALQRIGGGQARAPLGSAESGAAAAAPPPHYSRAASSSGAAEAGAVADAELPPAAPPPRGACGPADVEEKLRRRSQKLLGPFLSIAWHSDTCGLLAFEGDPGSGVLEVDHGSSAGGTFSPCRLVRVYEKGLVLQRGATPMVLMGPESHFKKRAVWRSEGGECEVWLAQGCSNEEQSAPEGASQPSAPSRPVPEPPPPRRAVGSQEEPRPAGAERPRPSAAAEAALEEGLAAFLAQRCEESEQRLTEALDDAGASLEVRLRSLCWRCHARVKLGSFADAAADAQEAMALNPQSALSHEVQAVVSWTRGDYAGASSSYRDALQRDPGNKTYWEALQQSLRLFLGPLRLPELTRTYDVRGTPLGHVWACCLPQGAPESARASFRSFGLTFRGSAFTHQGTTYPSFDLPYVVTLPSQPGGAGRRYPLLLYLHSAGTTDICSGNIVQRQLQFVAQESPAAVFFERGEQGRANEYIGLAPCCPSNVGQLDPNVAKSMRKRKVFWLKTCDGGAYQTWDFSQAARCFHLELLLTEFLAHVCETLPVDPSRIYFLGSSCGGYAVLRLGEVIPGLPAAVVPMAGYYPDIPGQDHDVSTMVNRLRGVKIWPMHCEQDKLCRVSEPGVRQLYSLLQERNGVTVEWVPGKVAKGSHSSYHSAHQRIFNNPELFFEQLSGLTRPSLQDAGAYLRRRLVELLPAPAAAPPPPPWT